MVYWGCGTTRNRCMWGMFVVAALAGSLLLIAGGAKLDICSKLPVYVHITGTCKMGPTAMMIIGAFVLLGAVPSLLFFSGCAQGPPQANYSEGVPASGITVVRRTAGGPQVFQYDSDGKLMAAPDCQRHTNKASSPQPYGMKDLKPVKSAPALPGPGSETKHDSAGDPPRHAARPRLYGSESDEAATAEVYISAVVPMGPLAAARAQQQQLHYQQQLQQQRQQQEHHQMEQQQEQRQLQGQQHHQQPE